MEQNEVTSHQKQQDAITNIAIFFVMVFVFVFIIIFVIAFVIV